VKLVSKKRPGVASCTAYAGGGFSLPIKGLTPEEHTELTLRTGCHVNDSSLVRVLSAEAEHAINQLETWGVHVRRYRGRASVRAKAPNPMVGGMGMTMPLVEQCQTLGVSTDHPVAITRLLQRSFGGTVVGAEGVTASGEHRMYLARQTVLATGGGGWLYARTDNPAGISGDGYLLALYAGAALRDMEFVQFYPLGSAPDAGVTWFMDAGILDHARLTDANGEEFLPELYQDWGISSGREANLYERDRLSQAIERRRRETGRVVLHLDEVPGSIRENDRLTHLAALLGGQRDDPWQPVEVAPVQHFMSGGVTIDEWGRTGVPGLLACGEVTGGTHGANRIGGNALSEITVFGLRAGELAARQASAQDTPGDSGSFLSPGRLAIEWGGRPGGTREFAVRSLRELAYDAIGPVRDRTGLSRAVAQLDSWASEPVQVASAGRDAWSLLQVARLIAASALKREESRGVHFRTDCPTERPDFRGNILLEPVRGERTSGDVALVVTPVLRPIEDE